MKTLPMALAALVFLAAPAARAQLSGQDRTLFLRGFNRACLRSLADDERFAGVSRGAFANICGCSGRRMAARLSIDDFRAELSRPVEERQAWMNEVGQEALSECASRHGGFIEGMTVMPNK